MNLKKSILIIFFYGFTFIVIAQDSVQRKFYKISYEIKPQKVFELVLDKIVQSNKIKNCLNYRCNENTNVSFCNDTSNENYTVYEELGRIENTNLIVINEITLNQEFYILLN